MNNELKQIKKKYGEHMMHLCRTLFPTILNEEGKLIEILDSTFGHPKYLYEDIIEKNAVSNFKDFIYYKYDNQKQKIDKSTKTPFQLMKDAGYTLYECKTNEDIMKFKKYYATGEKLCTFNDNRLKTNYVFFAVKNNVDDIKRENFKKPERQDEYGTSVISIQFSRGEVNTLSIKNRYNHTVNNPDATFDNDLESIIPGLTDSFENYYGFNINQSEKIHFGLDYVKAEDGKYYKYNMEINNIYYCPDNIIIINGRVIKDFIDKEKYLLIDYFILNLQNERFSDLQNTKFYSKSIKQFDKALDYDSFQYELEDFDKINIIKNDDGTKTIELIKPHQNPIYIEIDKCNNIIGYDNPNIRKIEHNFLKFNRKLNKIYIDNVEKIGNRFLFYNKDLVSLNLPSVTEIGRSFLYSCKNIKTINLPNVRIIADNFVGSNNSLEYLNAPNLEKVGESFLSFNDCLTSLVLPKVKYVEDNFLEQNKNLSYLEMPNLEEAGTRFMCSNNKLSIIDFPKLQILKYGFLLRVKYVKKINLPNVISIGDRCLESLEIDEINLPKVKVIGNDFMRRNNHLKKIYIPEVTSIGNCFLSHNEELEEILFPKLVNIGALFLRDNSNIYKVDLSSCEWIDDKFMINNKKLESISLPNVKSIGSQFLFSNEILKEFSADNLEEIYIGFLYCNKELKELYLPKLKFLSEQALVSNSSLENIYVPNLVDIPNDFSRKIDKLKVKQKKLIK